MSPFQCWVRSDTPSSTCKFIIPPALKPITNIGTGIQGVCDTLKSMQNSFRLPLRMLFYMLRTLALRLAFWGTVCNIARKFYAEYLPPTVYASPPGSEAVARVGKVPSAGGRTTWSSLSCNAILSKPCQAHLLNSISYRHFYFRLYPSCTIPWKIQRNPIELFW